jgi:D-3-phosphoglycerate dehydrogenase
VRYVNSGVTLGSVNLPEVNLRSLTLDEPNHARVIYIHNNVPGVLRKVNEILGDHNVDKQITDNKGDVAYLMADISSVTPNDLKEISDALEGLSCKFCNIVNLRYILTKSSSHSYSNFVLKAHKIFG